MVNIMVHIEPESETKFMNIMGTTADDLFLIGIQELDSTSEVLSSRVEPMREKLHVMFELTNPRNRVTFNRIINPAFAWVEVLWIMAGGNNVEYLAWWNKRMRDYANKDGHLHGAYGARLGNHHLWETSIWDSESGEEPPYLLPKDVRKVLYSKSGLACEHPQLMHAYSTLHQKPISRQVVLQIWQDWLDMPNGYHEQAPDIPCNLTSHLLLRQPQHIGNFGLNKLEWLQIMRSNDAIWGWPYNIIQWTFIQEIVAGWLGVEPGTFVLLSDSYHVYERHWPNLSKILNTPKNMRSLRCPHSYGLPFGQWRDAFRQMIPAAWELTQVPLGDEAKVVDALDIPYSYKVLMGMLAAEATRKKSDRSDLALSIANRYMNDNYWEVSWKQWHRSVESGDIY